MTDVVNKPDHYTSNTIECIDYLKDNLTPEAYRGYLEGCIKKYMHRFKRKGNPLTDLKKAEWYLKKLIEETEHAD